MGKDELITFLKDHLDIAIGKTEDDEIIVSLLLCGETISEDILYN